MKTLQQIRENIEITEAEDKKLTSLIRAGLFDVHKLPLLKRALSKDNTKMSAAERNSLLDLLDTLISHVTGDQAIFNKVRGNVMREDLDEAYEVAGELPMILILKRRSIRSFPDGQRVALYWADKLKTFISVPYSSVGVGYSPTVSEEVTLVSEGHMTKDDDYKTFRGRFQEKEHGQFFEYGTHDNKWAKAHGLNHKVYIGGEYRFGNIKGTVAHIAHDEDDDGKPVMQKWQIKRHAKFNTESDQFEDVDENDLNELSNNTLNAFVSKANYAHGTAKRNKAFAIDRHMSTDIADKAIKKTDRTKGIELAKKKIVKEENLDVMQKIVEDNTKRILNFSDGTQFNCGAFTASAILEVYSAINDTNKTKMEAALNESKVSFNKMAEFALSKV